MAVQGPIVITGASSGIGAACARYLDALGFTVWAGVRSTQDGEALTRLTSSRLRVLMLDVTDPASIEAARKTLAEATRDTGLAGLVNNAGISVAGPLELLPLSEVRTQFEVNVIGVLAVTQALLPLLRLARGRIVNISSIAGLAATPFLGAYCSSKFALEAMSDALRLELVLRFGGRGRGGAARCRWSSRVRSSRRYGNGLRCRPRAPSVVSSRRHSLCMLSRCPGCRR